METETVRRRRPFGSSSGKSSNIGDRKVRDSQKLQSDSPYMILAVKILLVLLILLMLPKLVTTKRSRTKSYVYNKHKAKSDLQTIRLECQTDPEVAPCARMIPEESLNCVNECMSDTCYAEVYGDNPLEPGEIDIERAKAFTKCVKNELYEIGKKQREEMREKKKKKKLEASESL